MDDIVYYQAEINKSTGSRLWLLGLDANELPNFVRASAVVMAKDEYTYLSTLVTLAGMVVFSVAGYHIEERCSWPVI